MGGAAVGVVVLPSTEVTSRFSVSTGTAMGAIARPAQDEATGNDAPRAPDAMRIITVTRWTSCPSSTEVTSQEPFNVLLRTRQCGTPQQKNYLHADLPASMRHVRMLCSMSGDA